MAIPNAFIRCELDGDACLVGTRAAWVYRNAEWTRLDLSRVAMDARLVGEPNFTLMFGKLPDLPAEALKDI